MSTVNKRVKALPPPHFGIVSVPLELLPAYYALWNIEPIPGSWQYNVTVHDHVLYVRKTDTHAQTVTKAQDVP